MAESKTRYKVAAPFVTVKHKDRDGQDLISGWYAGQTLPETTDPENIERLLGKDMIVAADDPIADIVAVPSGTPIPGEPPNVPVPEVPLTSHDQRMERARQLVGRGGKRSDTRDGGDSPDRDTQAKPAAKDASKDAGEPPAVNEPKQVWVDYAVASGEERLKAEAMSKEQLTGRFGKRG